MTKRTTQPPFGLVGKCLVLAYKTVKFLFTRGPYATFWTINDFFVRSEFRLSKEMLAGLEKDALVAERLAYSPLFSVVVPVYNVSPEHLRACVDSVLAQTYENWELCLVDDASTWPRVRETLREYENHPQIAIRFREKNGNISQASNDGIAMAKGEFLAFLDCDDALAPNALYAVARKLNEDPALDYIYSDEDRLTDDGKKRHTPFFKPDFSPDALMSMMYVCHLSVFRASFVRELGGFRLGVEGAQDYDLALRAVERTSKIGHVAKLLYHWRERAESTACDVEAKPYALEAARKAKVDALARRGVVGRLEKVEGLPHWRVVYAPPSSAAVSVVIPTKDNFAVFARCVDSIRACRSALPREIIAIDNGSSADVREKMDAFCLERGVRYIYRPMTFNFARMCNAAAREATGNILLFLNDDTEVVVDDWLERLAGHAVQPHTGAVGAKLLYPGGTKIQHVGVVSLRYGQPSHCIAGEDDETCHYFGVNRLEYNFLAVTGACLMIEREKFDRAGGFDEEFAVAYNDVALCFSLVKLGYYNVVRNDVRLYHHESLSRGLDALEPEKMRRQERERELLFTKHPEFALTDPYYNEVFDQNGLWHRMRDAHSVGVVARFPASALSDLPTGDMEIMVRVSVGEEFAHVIGYAFLRNGRLNDWRSRTVFFIPDEGDVLAVKTRKELMPDLLEDFPDQRHVACSRFSCTVAIAELRCGRYRIALGIGPVVFGKTRIAFTGKEVRREKTPSPIKPGWLFAHSELEEGK